MTTLDLARDIATQIANAHPTWEVVATHLPELDADKLTSRKISVVPKALQLSRQARGTTEKTHTVTLAIQDRLSPDPADPSFETLIADTEALAAELRDMRPLTLTCTRLTIDPLYSIDRARTAHIFTAVIEADYTGHV